VCVTRVMSLVFKTGAGRLTDHAGSSDFAASTLLLTGSVNPAAPLQALVVRSRVTSTELATSQTLAVGNVIGHEFALLDSVTYTSDLRGLQFSTRMSGISSTMTGSIIGINSSLYASGTWASTGPGLAGAAAAVVFEGDITAGSATGLSALLTSTSGSGSVFNAQGIKVLAPVPGDKTFTRYSGLWVDTSSVNTGTIKCGLRIGLQSGASTNYGIWFDSGATSSGQGIVFGGTGDTMLYRGAAGQLLTPGDWMARRYRCSSVPTVSAGPGAGTSPIIAISWADTSFSVSLTQGTPSATGVIFTVTMGAPSSGVPARATVSPGNASTAVLSGTSSVYITSTTTTVVLNSGSAALTAGTAYVWHFVCAFA
jgi:hypothetical protein